MFSHRVRNGAPTSNFKGTPSSHVTMASRGARDTFGDVSIRESAPPALRGRPIKPDALRFRTPLLFAHILRDMAYYYSRCHYCRHCHYYYYYYFHHHWVPLLIDTFNVNLIPVRRVIPTTTTTFGRHAPFGPDQWVSRKRDNNIVSSRVCTGGRHKRRTIPLRTYLFRYLFLSPGLFFKTISFVFFSGSDRLARPHRTR